MKKSFLITFIFAIVFAFVISPVTFAAAKTAKGKIKTSANTNANGASVSVTCNGTTLNDTTDSNGDFAVVFADGVCNDGDTVVMSASFNGESGGDSMAAGNGPIINFNTLQLSVVAVPEFGTWTALAAVIGSGLLFFMMKKRATENA